MNEFNKRQIRSFIIPKITYFEIMNFLLVSERYKIIDECVMVTEIL